VKIYEIFSATITPELQQLKEKYERARKYYNERDFTTAMREFEQLKNTGDRPSERFYERCKQFLLHPPDENWNGVWVFDHK